MTNLYLDCDRIVIPKPDPNTKFGPECPNNVSVKEDTLMTKRKLVIPFQYQRDGNDGVTKWPRREASIINKERAEQ